MRFKVPQRHTFLMIFLVLEYLSSATKKMQSVTSLCHYLRKPGLQVCHIYMPQLYSIKVTGLGLYSVTVFYERERERESNFCASTCQTNALRTCAFVALLAYIRCVLTLRKRIQNSATNAYAKGRAACVGSPKVTLVESNESIHPSSTHKEGKVQPT